MFFPAELAWAHQANGDTSAIFVYVNEGDQYNFFF